MPRPPPPPTALTSNGTPMLLASSRAASRECACATRGHRHAGLLRLGARAQLVADGLDLRRGRADEDESVLFAQARECGALGEKTVAGMDRVAAGAERRLHQGLGPEITGRWVRGPDAHDARRQARRQ